MAIPKDVFVFDCVCHIFNFDKKNAFGPAGDLFDEHLYAVSYTHLTLPTICSV